MRCRKCSTKAIIRLPRHNAAFCPSCFDEYVIEQVSRAIKGDRMFGHREAVAVAVSGGKDSLALWEILVRLGYRTMGLHIDLGIGEYSVASRKKVEVFAQARNLPFVVHSLVETHGLGISEMSEELRRPPCSACGVIKRYNMNAIAMHYEMPVLATGHNLDDEASRLLGNVLHWQDDYLAKQLPVLPNDHPKHARKVKPLYRLAEREIAAWAVIHKIDYIVDECPNSAGSKMLVYKDVLNRLEDASPGTKHQFYFQFLDRQKARAEAAPAAADLRECTSCGQPSTAEICSYCKLVATVQRRSEPAELTP
ncbi:MAG: TIGR00269 family protein [Nitrospiria bacterium]